MFSLHFILQDDNFVKVVKPQLGPSVGTLYFGHSYNHNVALKPKKRVGLDPKSYIGDKGGALWRDLCMVKGEDVKNKTISDFFHFEQDINRNSVYFGDQKSKKEFKSIMMDAYNSPTSLQAVDAEKRLVKLIEKNQQT